GSGGAYDEFVELHNPTDEEIDLSGYKLKSRGAGAENWLNRTGEGLKDLIMPAGSYLLLASDGYTGSTSADYKHDANWGFSDSGGSLRLENGEEEVLDEVNYGENAEAGTEAALADISLGSLERKAGADSSAESMDGEEKYAGNAYDSDMDSDFVFKDLADPQNSSSLYEPCAPPLPEP
ncbi:hypothetical protein GF382_01000, partial [Candidatus Falkowbacteria bacterium]|nr:hypothetical protein [Candidatus Falkowbacteria bacterium]